MKSTAKRYHYVYELCVDFLVDESLLAGVLGAGLPFLYLGMRSCDCRPEEDTGYWGSSAYVDAARAAGVPFFKTIKAVYSTRAQAAQHERQALKRLKYEDLNDEDPALKDLLVEVSVLLAKPYTPQTAWSMYLNRVVPGEFGAIDYANRLFVVKCNADRRGQQWCAEDHPQETRRGGPPKGHRQSAAHVAASRRSVISYWGDLRMFAAYHGLKIEGKGAPNIPREQFRSWRKTLASLPCHSATTAGRFVGDAAPPRTLTPRGRVDMTQPSERDQ
jgi:hypothetical protein